MAPLGVHNAYVIGPSSCAGSAPLVVLNLISKDANQSVDDDIHVNQDHSAAVFPSKTACD